MKRINWCHVLLLVLGFFIPSKSGVYGQNFIDFSFEKTGPNHSVLVLPVWHPVIKELQELDSLPSGMILGFDDDSLESVVSCWGSNGFFDSQNVYFDII